MVGMVKSQLVNAKTFVHEWIPHELALGDRGSKQKKEHD